MKSQCIDEGTLRAYVDGALSLAESAEVEGHLQECQVCRVSLSEQQLLASQVDGLLSSYLLVPAVEAAFQRTAAGLPMNRLSKAAKVVGPEPRSDAAHSTSVWRPRSSWLAMAGVGVAGVIVLAFVLPGFSGMRQAEQRSDSTTMSGGVLLPSNKQFTDFVPEGKVRHIVLDYSTEERNVISNLLRHIGSDEIWLANGQEHLLMRRETEVDPVNSGIGDRRLLVVNDEGALYYDPHMIMYDEQGNYREGSPDRIAYRMEYSPEFVAPYVPDRQFIEDLLLQPNVSITGEGRLGERPFKYLTSTGNVGQGVKIDRFLSLHSWSTMPLVGFNRLLVYMAPGIASVYKLEPVPRGVDATPEALMTPIVEVEGGSTSGGHIDYNLWLDSESYRVLMAQFITHGRMSGNSMTASDYETTTMTLKTDELLNVSAISPNLFAFDVAEVNKVVQAMPVFPALAPPEQMEGEESTWEVYRSPDGDFMAVVPGGKTSDSESGGWHRHTTVHEYVPVTYTVGYRDLDAPVEDAVRDRRFEAELATLVSQLRGVVTSSSVTMLSGNTGKEVILRHEDGTYTRMQAFLVGMRLYSISVSAPDEAALSSTSVTGSSYYWKYDLGIGTFLNSLSLLGR